MLVLGDAHADDPANRRSLFAAYRVADADAALQVGDLWFYRLPVPTHFVAGNNEDCDVIDALRNGLVEGPRVRNARLLASTAVEVRGLCVAGLSGNFAPSRFHLPRAALSEDRRRHFVHEDVEAATRLADRDVDVFLAHEAPHGLAVSEPYDVGCEYVDAIIDALEPDLCLVGHHHQHAESVVGSTRVVSLAPAWKSYYVLDPETLSLERFETPTV